MFIFLKCVSFKFFCLITATIMFVIIVSYNRTPTVYRVVNLKGLVWAAQSIDVT
jgi:hypothetical protein